MFNYSCVGWVVGGFLGKYRADLTDKIDQNSKTSNEGGCCIYLLHSLSLLFSLFIILDNMFTERRDFRVDIHLPFSLNAQILNII